MDSGVAFKSFTHFEEIFWCVVVRVFSFHSFAYVCSVFPATFIDYLMKTTSSLYALHTHVLN